MYNKGKLKMNKLYKVVENYKLLVLLAFDCLRYCMQMLSQQQVITTKSPKPNNHMNPDDSPDNS